MSDQPVTLKTSTIGAVPNSALPAKDLRSDLVIYQGSYVSGKQLSLFTEQKQRQSLALLGHAELLNDDDTLSRE
jgi:hypothetical protein